ncbi:hypothetical protein ASF18_12170 [Methylobacterium sp. Leaf89]|nr:hypothetical protein ASF18_12170 [Methylobacterium sp. Leaf89]
MPRHAPLIAGAILIGIAGSAAVADGSGTAGERPRSGSDAPAGSGTTSVGAGGLTGSGAIEEGSHRAGPDAASDKEPASSRPGAPGAPAAGTTR